MTDQERIAAGKFIALILRHHPETVGITLDHHGWADVTALLEGINASGKHYITPADLEEIVRKDDKQRYAFSADKTKIRANQGHSIPVDVELETKDPPQILYHGTGEKYTASINEQGLLPKSRLYVHLSRDIATARKVGSRHGRPVVYEVRAGQMCADGYEFFLSANGVWLTRTVPVKYLKELNE